MKCDSLFAVALVLGACVTQSLPLLCQNDSKQEPKDGTVVRTGPSGIMPPRAIYSPDPKYDDASRKAKIEGTVKLRIIVTPDGQVKDAKVAKSLSETLDKKSIEAVSQWKFAPATKDGKPVAAQIEVECTFKLK